MTRAFGFVLTIVSMANAADFISHEIATGLKGGYQVIAADLNRDGKPDLIALAPGTNELVWFENPGWQRHVILSNVPRMINCAAWDTDGDGIPAIALAYEFSNEAKKSIGIVAILKHNGDPTLPWVATEIDRLPTSHRLRWVTIDATGRKVLLDAPLTNASSEHPEDRLPVPLVYYVPGEWKRHELPPGNEGVQHGIFVLPDGFATASMSGIAKFQKKKGGTWIRQLLVSGSVAPWPKSGSSDIAFGKTGRNEFIAAIEPWHGNEVAIYRKLHGHWQRDVIDDSLKDGHTIVAADFDGNGNDSVVAGARGGDHSLHLYTWIGGKWTRSILDAGGMAAASCGVNDLNGDGLPDLFCISPVSMNLKWFENLKTQK